MNILALVLGGFVGTLLRYALGIWLPAQPEGFPLDILSVNLIGCLFLGWFLTLTMDQLRLRPELRLGLGTGMAGSFTTLSTFSLQTVLLLQNGELMLALLYVFASLLGGFGLVYAGVRLAEAQLRIGRDE